MRAEDPMEIRGYHPDDLLELMQLFRETVHNVNARDYTPEQLDAWAPPKLDEAAWHRRLSCNFSWIATLGARPVGFTNLEPGGLIDLLYVHHQHQNQGIARRLIACLE